MSEFIPSSERQRGILDLLLQQQRISVGEIVEQFAVSEATARRDLETLAEQGKIQRVHGGAVSLKHAPPESPILQRETEQADEKKRIGAAIANLLNDGETVFLGSGTTVLEVARNLRNRTGLTVITNSLPVLNMLAGLPSINIISLGGLLRHSEMSFIGHITEQALAEVRADKVVIGVHAISVENGLTNDYLPETLTDRAILRAGREVILAADHTKFGQVAAAHLAPVEAAHVIVTDFGTPPGMIEQLRARGIRVVTV